MPTNNQSAGLVTASLPFLKWAGGKRQLLARIVPLVPPVFQNYFEPFLGGGALFFELASLKSFKAFLSDSNAQLINAYLAVKDNVEKLIRFLERSQREYNRSPFLHYYQMRADWENRDSIEQAARLIALNHTCYNGLFRVNSKGKFNVPIGKYSNPLICDPDRLLAASNALNRTSASIETNDFEIAVQRAKKGDFIYLDPPFDPLSKTSSFVAYTKDRFGVEEQQRVYRLFKELDSRGCMVLVSNSDTPFIRALYSEFESSTYVQNTLRSINCKGSARANAKELLIANYAV